MSLKTKTACNEAIHLFEAERYNESFYLFKSIADEEPNACYFLYLHYSLGYGVEMDPEEARNWLARSIDGDYFEIYSNMDTIATLCSNRGEYAKVIAAAEKMITRKDTQGYHILAQVYTFGNDEVRDQEKGLEYYKLGAENKDIISMLYYGIFLYDGIFTEQNKEAGIKYIVDAYKYEKDSKNFYNARQNTLVLSGTNTTFIVLELAQGIIEKDFMEYLPEDFAKKIITEDLVEEAEKDNKCMHLLGEALLIGRYCDKRPKEALKLLRKSYEEGYEQAFEEYKKAYLEVVKTCSEEEFSLDELESESKWLIDHIKDANDAFDFTYYKVGSINDMPKRSGFDPFYILMTYLIEKNNINAIIFMANLYSKDSNTAKVLDYYRRGYELGDLLCKLRLGILYLFNSSSPEYNQKGMEMLNEIIAMDEEAINNYSISIQSTNTCFNDLRDSFADYPIHLKIYAMEYQLAYLKEKQAADTDSIIAITKTIIDLCIRVYKSYQANKAAISYRRTLCTRIYLLYQDINIIITDKNKKEFINNQLIIWGKNLLKEHDRLLKEKFYSKRLLNDLDYDKADRKNRCFISKSLGDYYRYSGERFNPLRVEKYYLASIEDIHFCFSNEPKCEMHKALIFGDLGDIFNDPVMGEVGYYKAFGYYQKAIAISNKLLADASIDGEIKKPISDSLFLISEKAGIMAEAGFGTPVNEDLAIELYKISSSLGNTTLEDRMKRLIERRNKRK